MGHRRRNLIRMAGVAAVGAATGCIGGEGDDNTPEGAGEDANEDGGGDGAEDAEEMTDDAEGGEEASPELAAAASLNVLRTRLHDAVALGRAGETDAAAEEASGVFAYFEEAGGEYGVHEFVEATDEEAYEGFEESLGALRTSLEEGDVETAAEEASSADGHLASVQSTAVSEDAAGTLGLLTLASRLHDARFVSEAGGNGGDVGTEVFSAFETAEFHDAVSEANKESYESFESAMGDVSNGDAGRASDAFASAVEAAYSMSEDAAQVGYISSMVSRAHDARLVSANGGDGSSLMRDVFAGWEEARAHEAIEDGEAYETFEGALEGYVNSLGGDGAEESLSEFDEAATRARFALANASDRSPVGESSGHDHEHGHGGETEMTGGPDVYEGEPGDADHVVDCNAVAFDPETLEVSQGDTVAWVYAGGEPHSVTAYSDGIPEDAEYWASGGFPSEQAAREGWENGEGAVTEGTYYVHTFETTGTHEYVCIPHEAAGMVGEVVVE